MRSTRFRPAAAAIRGHLGRICLAGVVIASVGVAAPRLASGTVRHVSGSGGTLIIGMTAGNIPPLDTVLSGSQGYEGYRFVGFQLYDGLTGFNLLQATKTPPIVGDLATSWTTNSNATDWTFHLRSGVKFQDGTPFNAAAVIFNFERYFDTKFKYYDATVGATASTLFTAKPTYSAPNSMTIELKLTSPDAHLPSDLTTLFMASPTAVEKEGNIGFGSHPVGTGPFQFSSETTGQELVLKPNKSYWAGAPKLSELVLKPIPDPSARIAALRSGEVNWIEYPTPDDIASLKSSGYQILTNSYDHIWPWIFNDDAKPWNNQLVREAANYAINRQAMVTNVLHGTADPAYQLTPEANAAYTPSNFTYSYDPAKAKALLKQAGYSNGVAATISYPTSGSGNMIPGPMNEELQQDLAAVGIKVTLIPMEWATMLQQFETAKMPDGATATNISLTFLQESTWSLLFDSKSPLNLSHFDSPQVDADFAKAQETVGAAARAKLYANASNIITKAAPWLFVVNDRNPRALAPTVHGFIEPKSWFVNLTTVWVG